MRVVLFGASGMVGQGALRELLRDPRVERVLAVGRSASGTTDAKLVELTHRDFNDFSAVEADLRGYDACLYCLGVSAAGMTEAEYRRVTYDFTLAAATTLARLNPAMTFVYVSGQGTDSTEMSRMTWARVKGATENALLKLPFERAYMMRPGFIQPLHGVRSKTKLYRTLYAVFAPFYSLLSRLAPASMITSEALGRAMIQACLEGADRAVLEGADLKRLASAYALSA